MSLIICLYFPLSSFTIFSISSFVASNKAFCSINVVLLVAKLFNIVFCVNCKWELVFIFGGEILEFSSSRFEEKRVDELTGKSIDSERDKFCYKDLW